MRIVTCPKCSSTRCSEMATKHVGEVVRMQCQGCSYYAERKEFDIQYLSEGFDMFREWMKRW